MATDTSNKKIIQHCYYFSALDCCQTYFPSHSCDLGRNLYIEETHPARLQIVAVQTVPYQ